MNTICLKDALQTDTTGAQAPGQPAVKSVAQVSLKTQVNAFPLQALTIASELS